MRGDTATENGVEGGDHEEQAAAEPVSGDRRPSIVTLQTMLKKVSQSPFHSQYKTLVSSPSDSSGSSDRQDGEFLSDRSAAGTDAMDDRRRLHLGQNGLKTEDSHRLPSTAQNGVSGGLARMNPFYANYLESSRKSLSLPDAGKGTSEEANLDPVFIPPPEFQSSPLDLEPGFKTLESGGKFCEPEKNPFQTLSRNPPHTALTCAGARFDDDTLNPPDLFKANVPQNLSRAAQSTDLLQAATAEDFLHTENLFDPLKSDLFPSSRPAAANPFYTPSAGAADLFQAKRENESEQAPSGKEKMSSTKSLDVFSSLSTSTFDPFPSPITRDLFQDVSSLEDPFGTTPSKPYNPFRDVSNGNPDFFRPLPSNSNSVDAFETAFSDTEAAPAPGSLGGTSETELPPSLDLFKATPSGGRRGLVSTTPQGTKLAILQPTPFSQAGNLSASPGQSPAEMTHVQTFKRPPRPLPRTRLPRTSRSRTALPGPAPPPGPEKPPKPETPPKPERPPAPTKLLEPEPAVPKTSPKPALRSLPKPAVRHKPKTPDSKTLDPESLVVFEDVLLIGQEKCVEDWPEDSPELNPAFKPSGKLRLRRESLKVKTDSDGGSGEDHDGSGSQSKKKDKKFRMSLLSRRGSKDKFPDDSKEGRSRTLPIPRKSSKDFSDVYMAAEEDAEQYVMDYKKKPLKTKVNQLLRRASTTSSVFEGKHLSEDLPQESKGTALGDSTGEEEDQQEEKKKNRLKIKFVPHRGFAITVEKKDEELKGAHGYTTPRKGSKEKSQDEVLGAHGYTPRKKSQDDAFEGVEEMNGLESTTKAAAFMDEKKPPRSSPGLDGDEDVYGMEDFKPQKKSTKKKLLRVGRRSSKEDMLDDATPQKKKSSFSAEELDDEELYGTGDYKQKKSKQKVPPPVPRKPKTVYDTSAQSEIGPQASADAGAEYEPAGKDFTSPGEMFESEEDELESCKPKKSSKLKGLLKSKGKSKATYPECDDPPGVASADFLSEAAKAEWLAAQKDERAMAGFEDEDEEGDTDSLMEWWYTVEQWDEVPSDDENKVIKENESKSFTILADKVDRGLRVFNKVFTERAEVLWHYVIKLHAIADDISTFHQKAKIAGITGGTTTAVGGVTAIAGLALAPFTFGASLVVTAVGVGVATAGGIASASAAISDNVNNMQDRKKVETVLQEYEAHLLDIAKILHFVNQAFYKLRGHPFLRSGTQHYAEDWEIRRAVQMISLGDAPVMRATDITDAAVASVQGLFKGMDKYFIKDSRELKKGCKKEIVCQIKGVANVLNDAIVELNAIREELQEATGNM